ncbi:MAG: hypothetical protein ACTSRU_21355 [Candidatus Hodarchaeales archaeon]
MGKDRITLEFIYDGYYAYVDTAFVGRVNGLPVGIQQSNTSYRDLVAKYFLFHNKKVEVDDAGLFSTQLSDNDKRFLEVASQFSAQRFSVWRKAYNMIFVEHKSRKDVLEFLELEALSEALSS